MLHPLYSFQEAFKSQVDDLQALLGEGWRWVGVGRDDGFQQGEYAPIFYVRAPCFRFSLSGPPS